MEKVTTEYYRRIRIIWNSELNAKNKTTAHNCFALPIIVTTIGILDWTIKQLEDIDIRTRKILTMTGNFHTNSDKDRLYVPRKEGGRGLKSIEDCYKSRIVGLRRHIIRDKERNHLLESVFDHEQERILRIGKQYEEMYIKNTVDTELELTSRAAAKKVKNSVQNNHKETWTDKKIHGYIQRKVKEKGDMNEKKRFEWLKEGKLSGHMEGYLCAIEEQEIETRSLQKSREKDENIRKTMNSKCRLCHQQEETIFHVLGSCSPLSSSLYLHNRHNKVAKIVHDEITANEKDARRKQHGVPQEITRVGEKEIWWDKIIDTPGKINHNRPDIVLWELDTKVCKIIDICVPLDFNVTLCETTKRDNYTPLVGQLKKMYPGYTYTIIPVVIGALGTVPRKLKENLEKIGIQGIESTISKMQKMAILGGINIVKTFRAM